MANIKQQKKRILTNEKRHALVSSFKASVKTAMKAVYAAVDKKDLAAAETALNFANKKLDKAQAKGIVHKNYVARQKSALAAAVNSLK